MKDYLESEGILVRSPREAIKEAYRIGLIDRGELWLSALQERNLAAHTYDERILEEFTEEIRHEFFPLMITLKDNLERSL
jgi:nucleotidyltransferase substrate binding protein (TIGR01987 family)